MRSKLKIIIPIGIALIAIALAFVFIRFAPTKSTDIGTMISTAQQYLTEQKYEQAIAEFQKIIEIDPKNADAYIGMAKAYIGIGDTDKAVEVLEDGYEQTNDDRILEMLEELKSGEETAETTDSENEITQTDDTDEDEEEEGEVRQQEVISFMLPYSITNDGEYDLNKIKDVVSNGIEFMYYNYDNILDYSLYKECDKNHYGTRSSLATLDYANYLFPQRWRAYFVGDNNFYKPEPFDERSFPVSIYHADGTPIQEEKDYYNKKDQLIKREYYNEEGLNFTEKFEYDENGKLIKKTTSSAQLMNIEEYKYDLNGYLAEKIDNSANHYKYKYDGNGNIIETSFKNDNGGDGSATHYEYDSNGNIIMYEDGYSKYYWEYYEDGTVSKHRSERNDYYVKDEIDYSEYIYDRSGVISESIDSRMQEVQSFLDGEEKNYYVRSVTKMSYDDYGNQTSQYTTDDGNVKIDIKYTNTYDSEGRLISKVKTENDFLHNTETTITTFEYDNNGNLVKEISGDTTTTYKYNSNNKLVTELFKINSKWQDDEYRYEYEYDSYGNAVKCTKYYNGEYDSSEAVTEFIRVDIPKYIVDSIAK